MKHKLMILMLGVLALGGCAARGQQVARKNTEQARVEVSNPCETDADCENGYILEPLYVTKHAGHFDAVNMAGVMLSEFETRGQLEAYAKQNGFKLIDSGESTKAAKHVYYCEAIKADGTRCKRHVKEAGLLCWQHSAMVKAGKTVKTVD